MKIPLEEQETIIRIDYYEKTVSLYTNRKIVANKLIKSIGTPNKIGCIKGDSFDFEWKISFDNRDYIKKMLLLKILLFQKRKIIK